MKRLLIIALFMLGMAITAAQAVPNALLFAQAAPETQKAEPAGSTAAQPAPAETPPLQAPAATEAKPEPAPAKAAQSAPAAPGKQSHKEFAGMAIKECAGCHKGEGVAATHGAFWTREHGSSR